MSLEQHIADLTASVQELTAVIQGQSLGNVPTGTASTPDTVTPAPVVTAPAPAPSVPVAPAPVAVAPPTPTVAVTPAVASPSSVTLDQVKQEVTAAYQSATPEKQAQIMATVNQYAPSLTEIPPEQFANVINAVRAL